ncbi:hypothetical protein K470DRAFT_254698 [Piedraia hortae CBS 480.64]|uniref:Myb-like domain-containing protein n=1 Tax=Piedraia hortae CBS 480.64 TaxID=1314780 RepID=A0A6A7C8P2_9PEZI|nr:hypothetical protein K470DRAFT_254698 [Piedraia hortae CBS 480.64]
MAKKTDTAQLPSTNGPRQTRSQSRTVGEGEQREMGPHRPTLTGVDDAPELDADILLDVLPNLLTAADQLTDLLLSPHEQREAMLRDIHTPGSKLHKLCKSCATLLKVQKECLGSAPYIRPEHVVRALFGPQPPPNWASEPWSPNDIIYRINLAEMLRTLLLDITDPAAPTPENIRAFELLENNFPAAISGPTVDALAFIAIQTQLLLMRLQTLERTDGDAHNLLADVFLTQNNGNTAYKFPGVLDASSNSMLQEILRRLTMELGNWKHDPDGVLTSLRSYFPWIRFINYAIDFCTERKRQVDQNIAAAGGPHIIFERLADVHRGSLSKTNTAKSRVAQLKAREKRMAASQSGVMDPRLMAEGEVAQLTPTKVDQLLVFQENQMHGGRRRFADRQANATRIEFDDSPKPSQTYVPDHIEFDQTQNQGFLSDIPPRDNKRPHSPDANDPAYQEPSNPRSRRRADDRPQPRTQQIRTPWTPEEEATLLSLIGQKKDQPLSYAQLKRYDNANGAALSLRTPEDIRFKARNMKLTLLLGNVELPEGWNRVILDKKAILKLQEQGIPYEQRRIRRVGNAQPGDPHSAIGSEAGSVATGREVSMMRDGAMVRDPSTTGSTMEQDLRANLGRATLEGSMAGDAMGRDTTANRDGLVNGDARDLSQMLGRDRHMDVQHAEQANMVSRLRSAMQ